MDFLFYLRELELLTFVSINIVQFYLAALIEGPEDGMQIPFSQRCWLRNPIPINKIS